MGYDINRMQWIDNARAFGIVAVVFTHAQSSSEYLNTLLGNLHMPLFFFLSGFLLKQIYLEMPFIRYVKKNIKTLIIPYGLFWSLSYIYWLLTWKFGTQVEKYIAIKFYEPFWGLIYGTRDGLYVNQVLWFFPCLFITALIFYILNNVRNRYGRTAIIIGVGLLSPLLFNTPLPWNINVSCVALVFYAFGHWCMKHNFFSLLTGDIKLSFIVVCACLLFLFIFSTYNGLISMAESNYGNILLFYLNALLGITTVTILSHFFSSTKLVAWLSANTIIIFPTHFLMFSIITGFSLLFFGVRISDQYVGILYTIISIVLCIPASYIIRRYMPFVIGYR